MKKTKQQLTKEFRQTHPNYDAEWRDNNRDKLRKQQRDYYKRHIEKERVRSKLKYRARYNSNPVKMREYWVKYAKTQKGKFQTYRKQAKSRGYSFKITFDEFIKYWDKPCVYCGSEINGIGIDRVDNKRGYIKGNIVSCCAICNHMKKDTGMTEFIKHCRKIVDHTS